MAATPKSLGGSSFGTGSLHEPSEDGSAAEAAASSSSRPKPLRDADVPGFLEPYGFQASTAIDWRAPPPELTIQVSGHSTAGGHTLYRVECVLAASGLRRSGGECALAWQSERRLADLRAGLHDPVRKALGSSYAPYFCGVHFAHRLRPSGTTSRLDAWCRKLSYCITSRLVPPWIAAEALRVLGVPAMAGEEEDEAGGGEKQVSSQPKAAKAAFAAIISHPGHVNMSVAEGAGDAVSTCTGGEHSARGIDGEEQECPAMVGFAEEGASDAADGAASWHGTEEDDDDQRAEPDDGGRGRGRGCGRGGEVRGDGGEEDGEEDDEDDLTEEVLRSGLPGLDD